MTSTKAPAFAIPPHVLYRQVDGQMVLLDLDSERYFGLNEVGADMITRLTDQPYAAALASLTSDYEVDPNVLHRDVTELVEALLDAGLLERAEGSP